MPVAEDVSCPVLDVVHNPVPGSLHMRRACFAAMSSAHGCVLRLLTPCKGREAETVLHRYCTRLQTGCVHDCRHVQKTANTIAYNIEVVGFQLG